MGAQKNMWKGLRWRVGNGASIQIWDDRWVPFIPRSFILSAAMGLVNDALVRKLVNLATETWNATLIGSYFPTVIAQTIM